MGDHCLTVVIMLDPSNDRLDIFHPSASDTGGIYIFLDETSVSLEFFGFFLKHKRRHTPDFSVGNLECSRFFGNQTGVAIRLARTRTPPPKPFINYKSKSTAASSGSYPFCRKELTVVVISSPWIHFNVSLAFRNVIQGLFIWLHSIGSS